MDVNLAQINQARDEEEYVLLDLDDVCVDADIPANAPYVLSVSWGSSLDKKIFLLFRIYDKCIQNFLGRYKGLDSMNPVLVIGNCLKLVGEYQETLGTCFIFSEKDGTPTRTCPERTPNETASLEGEQNVDLKQGPSKQVNPIASLHKILKFKLVSEDQDEMAEKVEDKSS